jgi:DNA mismatch repair ATPase MutL
VLRTTKASVETDRKAAGVMVERDGQGHRPCRVVDNGSGIHLADFH